MVWYGWLLLALAAISTVAFVIVLIVKSRPIVRGLSEEEREALLDAEKKRVAKELIIEQDKVAKLENLARELKDHLKMLQTWYEEAKHGIAVSRRAEFETYLGDPDVAGAELDKLLGIESSGEEKEDRNEDDTSSPVFISTDH